MMMNEKTYDREAFDYAQAILHSNDIELHYHYNFMGYIKMIMGGTALPKSVDVFDLDTHVLITHIEDKDVLSALAGD